MFSKAMSFKQRNKKAIISYIWKIFYCIGDFKLLKLKIITFILFYYDECIVLHITSDFLSLNSGFETLAIHNYLYFLYAIL